MEALGIRDSLRQVGLLAPKPIEIASGFLDCAGSVGARFVGSTLRNSVEMRTDASSAKRISIDSTKA
jgi:hypothetical protein